MTFRRFKLLLLALNPLFWNKNEVQPVAGDQASQRAASRHFERRDGMGRSPVVREFPVSNRSSVTHAPPKVCFLAIMVVLVGGVTGRSIAGSAKPTSGLEAEVQQAEVKASSEESYEGSHAETDTASMEATHVNSKQHSAYVPEGYGCIWHDEFDGVNCRENGCELNTEYWQFQNLNVNNETMLYTQRQCTNYPEDYNYCIRDGVFSIHARDEGKLVRCDDVNCADDYGWQCHFGTGCADREERYTSGRTMTKNKFAAKYGYVEVAFRLPFSRQGTSQRGLWPAFWMLDATIAEGPSSCGREPLDRSCENPWPAAGEIDILEHVSATPDLLFHNVHWDPGVNGPGFDHRSCDIRPSDVCSENMGWRKDIGTGFKIGWRRWNVIGIQWEKNSIKWMLNGQLNSIMDTTGEEELNRAMYPIMNIAVGGNMGGEVAIQDWTDAFLEFAYIRWYQKGTKDECSLE